MSFEATMHDMLIVSVPTVVVLFGILLNRQDATTIRTEMANLRNEMKAEISNLRLEMRADLAQLRAEVKGDINALRSETIALRDSIHRDMIGLHERLAVVESKQNN